MQARANDIVADMSKIQTLLLHLTGRRTVPNVLFDFESVGGSDEITLLHGEGGLQKMFQESGLMVGWGWKKEKGLKRPVFKEDLDDNIPANIRKQLEDGDLEVRESEESPDARADF